MGLSLILDGCTRKESSSIVDIAPYICGFLFTALYYSYIRYTYKRFMFLLYMTSPWIIYTVDVPDDP